MLHKVEELLDRILPDLARGSKQREQATQEVVEKSAKIREKSEQAMFDAYRAAGIAVVGQRNHRKWED